MNESQLPDELGISDYKVVEGDDATKIAHKWLAHFCSHRTSFKGILGGKTYLWDEIHSEYQNKDAMEQYESHFAPSYILMDDNFGQHGHKLFVSRVKPQGNSHLGDFHVFPKNFAWSMAFTHEDGWLGPIFFKHAKYGTLNKQNEKSMYQIQRGYV